MVRYNFPEYEIELEISEDVYFPSEDTFFLINSLEIQNDDCFVVEIGSGSGIIAIALAKKYPKLQLIVSDISYEAAKMIKLNVKLNEVNKQIEIVCMDKIYALKKISPDLIIWNPPYLPENDENKAFRKLERLMLFGGDKGYEDVYQLINYFDEHKIRTTFITIFSSLAWDPSKFNTKIEFEILATTKFFFEKLYLVKFDFSDDNDK